MNEYRVITDYIDNVHLLHTIQHQTAWNICHGLSVVNLSRRAEQLRNDLLLFDDLIDKIPDRRTRNAMRCRYALGMTADEASIYLHMSKGNMMRLIASGRMIIENLEQDPECV